MSARLHDTIEQDLFQLAHVTQSRLGEPQLCFQSFALSMSVGRISGCLLTLTTCSQSTRLKRLRQAATGYLLRVVPTGYSVGIVSFSKTASIRQHLTKITSRTEREDLVYSLPRGASGNTAIGQGLNLGVEVLLCNCILTNNNNTRQ